MTPPSLLRPEPLLDDVRALPVGRSTPPQRAAANLMDGHRLCVSDDYGTGLNILAALSALLRPPPEEASYAQRQAFQQHFTATASRLFVRVADHRVAVSGAPSIGFLTELYPDHSTFTLPFVEVEALKNAWHWYKKGVHFAVLGHSIHPYYGTYAPQRVIHLELFGTWLSQYKGRRGHAIDVGTGCGVLALMLARAGFEQVEATDINPNAIESIRRDLKRLPTPPSIRLFHRDLLGTGSSTFDVIVFNPPWVRGSVEGPLDRALQFEDGLFERFFDQASRRLAPSGRVVVVFSNLMRLVQPDVPHPIDAEIVRGRFKVVQTLRRKVKPTTTKGGRRRSTREKVEVWELARANSPHR